MTLYPAPSPRRKLEEVNLDFASDSTFVVCRREEGGEPVFYEVDSRTKEEKPYKFPEIMTEKEKRLLGIIRRHLSRYIEQKALEENSMLYEDENHQVALLPGEPKPYIESPYKRRTNIFTKASVGKFIPQTEMEEVAFRDTFVDLATLVQERIEDVLRKRYALRGDAHNVIP